MSLAQETIPNTEGGAWEKKEEEKMVKSTESTKVPWTDSEIFSLKKESQKI